MRDNPFVVFAASLTSLVQAGVGEGMKKLGMMACVLFAGPAWADPTDVHATAVAIFDRIPAVEVVDDLGEACGGGGNSNPDIGYCATGNTIFVTPAFAGQPDASYEMAHVLGHAIQVRHGVADIALRTIRSRPTDETALRGMVTRQVECVAGVLMARAGLARFDLRALGAEPFTEAHWGRNPLNSGPRVSIGLEPRAEWYDTGYRAANFAVCSVGEMSSDLIVAAQR